MLKICIAYDTIRTKILKLYYKINKISYFENIHICLKLRS